MTADLIEALHPLAHAHDGHPAPVFNEEPVDN
jgi:hypothetical protein